LTNEKGALTNKKETSLFPLLCSFSFVPTFLLRFMKFISSTIISTVCSLVCLFCSFLFFFFSFSLNLRPLSLFFTHRMDTAWKCACVIQASTMDEISEMGTHGLRKGKWTAEEEEYTRKLVQYFNQGLLNTIPDGTTLRSFLSSRLQCDRMRITKKFRGVSKTMKKRE